MTKTDFLEWMALRAKQTGKPYRPANASRDLGVHQATIDRALSAGRDFDKRTALACAAIAVGIAPFSAEKSKNSVANLR